MLIYEGNYLIMTEIERIIIETIYDNTVFKFSVASAMEKSKSNIAIEELGSLLKLRKQLFSEKDMISLIRFIDKIGFDFNQLFVVEKVSSHGEIIYTLGFINSNTTVDVHIEYDGNVIHAGIIMDMPLKNG